MCMHVFMFNLMPSFKYPTSGTQLTPSTNIEIGSAIDARCSMMPLTLKETLLACGRVGLSVSKHVVHCFVFIFTADYCVT